MFMYTVHCTWYMVRGSNSSPYSMATGLGYFQFFSWAFVYLISFDNTIYITDMDRLVACAAADRLVRYLFLLFGPQKFSLYCILHRWSLTDTPPHTPAHSTQFNILAAPQLCDIAFAYDGRKIRTSQKLFVQKHFVLVSPGERENFMS